MHDSAHTVTAVDETLQRSNLGELKEGDVINLERAMAMNGRLDGHLVQGHVDNTAECISVEDQNGSRLYTFGLASSQQSLLVEKGSVCVNGVSLTAFNVKPDSFSVAIIPYTYEHTNFNRLKSKDRVNIEFDVIGKYVAKWMESYRSLK
jgi:riboflavin synthase